MGRQPRSEVTRRKIMFNPTARHSYVNFVDQFTSDIKRAETDGDLRPGADPADVANTLVAWILGAELMSSAASDGNDLRERFARQWRVLMPAIVTADSLDRHLAFMAAASTRQTNTVEQTTT